MSTQVRYTSELPDSYGHGNTSTSTSIEMSRFGPSHSHSHSHSHSLYSESIRSAPPPYSDPPTSFHPTVHLQIKTPGKHRPSTPLPLAPDPIPIFPVDSQAAQGSTALPPTPQYTSLRASRTSGSCCLVAGGPSPSGSASTTTTPLSTTTYRFGPGRSPCVRLIAPSQSQPPPPPPFSFSSDGTASHSSQSQSQPPSPSPSPFSISSLDQQDKDETDSLTTYDTFELKTTGLLTRSVSFTTHFGAFEWRYASRKERKAHSPPLNNLLILDRVVRVFGARNNFNMGLGMNLGMNLNLGESGGAKDKDTVIRTPVAKLLRSAEYRSQGSNAISAGNGGRLVVDLSRWDEEEKTVREMVLVMVVTTCLVMLKKEVDRARGEGIGGNMWLWDVLRP